MTKFKVGDIVWCTVHGTYAFTGYHIKCVVTDIENDDVFRVAIPQQSTKYNVLQSRFELVNKPINWKKRLSK